MENRKLGVHIAPGAIKIVELEQAGKKFVLTNYSLDYFSLESSPELQAKNLIAALKKSHLRSKQANLVVSGAEVIYKLIDLPSLSEKEVASALKYKIRSFLPAAFKEIVLDYYKLEKISRPDKNLYFAAVAPTENLLGLVKACKDSGIMVKDIIAPSCALKNVFEMASLPPSAIVYLGKYSSIIVLVKGGQAVFAREMRMGGEDIAQSMVGTVVTEQGKLEIDYNRAEEIKNKFGVPLDLELYTAEAGVPASEILAMMRPALERITTEISNTFEYYRNEIGDTDDFKKMYFSGGAAATKNLLEYFKSQLNIDADFMTVNVAVEKDEQKDKLPLLSMAIGSVLAGKDQLGLLPKAEKRFSLESLFPIILEALVKIKGCLFFTCLFLVVLAALFSWVSGQKSQLAARQRILHEQYFKEVAELAKKVETAKGLVDLSRFKEKDRFSLLMKNLNSITPSDINLISVNYENKANQLIIRGVMPRNNRKISLPAFMKNLAGDKHVTAIDLVSFNESETYSKPTYYFELTCRLAARDSQ